MKSIVPYTKEITFNSKIVEICSISLEHELNIGESEIEGNFIVSGEFRSHEVSINKEPFSYKLPFQVDVTDSILKDSIEFEITDFTYEILKENTLKVDIEFCITAEEIENPVEEIEEIEEEEEVLEEQREEKIEPEASEIREAVIEEINNLFPGEEENKEEEKEEEEERIDAESEAVVLNSVEEKEDEFVTYHIHIVKEMDTLESICTMYQTDFNTIKEYNNTENITIGDKIIIPCLDE